MERIGEYIEAIADAFEGAHGVYPERPAWRIEEYLEAILTYIWEDETHPRSACPTPVWRIEECLRAIYDAMTGAAEPWPFPTPTTRIEVYLHAIYAQLDGTTETVPEPVWDIERLLMRVLTAIRTGGVEELTGDIISFIGRDDGTTELLSLSVPFSPIQSGSGTPSPDNVRPITGRTGLNVYVSPTQDQQDATTYAADWTSEAGTVYGGTLDVVTGVLKVDRVMYVADGTKNVFSVNYGSISGLYYVIVTASAHGKATNPPIISNRFKGVGAVAIGNCYLTSDGNYIVAVLPDQTVTSVGQATQWFADNPTQFVYEPSSTLTYQLTPQEVELLVGQNYLWADTGEDVVARIKRAAHG